MEGLLVDVAFGGQACMCTWKRRSWLALHTAHSTWNSGEKELQWLHLRQPARAREALRLRPLRVAAGGANRRARVKQLPCSLERAWLRHSSCPGPAAIIRGLLVVAGTLLRPRPRCPPPAAARPARARTAAGAARSTSDAAPQSQLSGLGLLAMLPARRRPGWSPERPRACACVVRVCRCCVPRAAGFARARTCSRQVCVLTTRYSHHSSYEQHRNRV